MAEYLYTICEHCARPFLIGEVIDNKEVLYKKNKCIECPECNNYTPNEIKDRAQSILQEIKKYEKNNSAKFDEGKLQISLVPTQIIEDIARVRMYGNEKYGDPNNWQTVEKQRYIDALLRHTILYLNDPGGVDDESGIPHHMHMACNLAFICEMEHWEEVDKECKDLVKELEKKFNYPKTMSFGFNNSSIGIINREEQFFGDPDIEGKR